MSSRVDSGTASVSTSLPSPPPLRPPRLGIMQRWRIIHEPHIVVRSEASSLAMAIGKLMADRIAVGTLEGDWVRLASRGYVKVRNRYGEPALTPVGDAP